MVKLLILHFQTKNHTIFTLDCSSINLWYSSQLITFAASLATSLAPFLLQKIMNLTPWQGKMTAGRRVSTPRMVLKLWRLRTRPILLQDWQVRQAISPPKPIQKNIISQAFLTNFMYYFLPHQLRRMQSLLSGGMGFTRSSLRRRTYFWQPVGQGCEPASVIIKYRKGRDTKPTLFSKTNQPPPYPPALSSILIMLNNSNQIIQTQLLELFNSIKVDKSKEAAIEKSTLISLLIYHQVDTQYPEYFRYVSRALERFKKSTVTQEEFLKIFMNPEVDMGMADKNELADAFGILDSKKTGSIDVKEFLQAYRMSQNYQQLTEDKKRQAEDEIKEAFYSASEDGKITPMDFYHIVKFR